MKPESTNPPPATPYHADADWLDLLLHHAAEHAEMADSGFSATLMQRLPAPAPARAMPLPRWFRAMNIGLLILSCVMLIGLLAWITPALPGVLTLHPGWRLDTAALPRLEALLPLALLAAWLAWWSKMTLGEFIWPGFA